MPLEIAADNIHDIRAAAPVADRIELCRDLAAHGLTPDPSLIRAAREAIAQATSLHTGHQHRRSPALIALIRPTQATHADESTLSLMQRQIEDSLAAGADEIALGILLPGTPPLRGGSSSSHGRIDAPACRRLLRLCANRPITFHRAVDLTPSPEGAIAQLADLGIARVLSAGLPSLDHSLLPLPQRLANLSRLVDRAAGRIAIVACGGVRSANAAAFLRITPEIHSSCRLAPADAPAAFSPSEAAQLASMVRDRPPPSRPT